MACVDTAYRPFVCCDVNDTCEIHGAIVACNVLNPLSNSGGVE